MTVNHDHITKELEISQPTHWGFWGTLLWGLLIAFVFVVLQAISMIIILLTQKRYSSSSELEQAFVSAATDGFVLSVSTFVTTILCTGLVIGIIKLKKDTVLKEYLGIRPVTFTTMLLWIGILAVFIVLANMIALALGRPIVPEFVSAIYASAHPMWMLWVALIIAAPLFEEVFFRGFLFQGFASSFMGPVGAVFVTSGLWASIHTQYDTHDKLVIFCLGLLLGAARVRTGSLLAPLGMHAAGNLESTLETALLG